MDLLGAPTSLTARLLLLVDRGVRWQTGANFSHNQLVLSTPGDQNCSWYPRKCVAEKQLSRLCGCARTPSLA
jgi:hypothetical protein